ncbi:hypothetical protein UFOVP273_40 [uncultured Caudovirales phage]|uniref:Uncharacterized protein n=1 Tax=uncultured Caudovirales phage TaxID=2100421 RepID=A0A6J5LMR9_9CAUD|nr:hypothetical protein UFOVP273_40 [uncultured Caudovirales phage]
MSELTKQLDIVRSDKKPKPVFELDPIHNLKYDTPYSIIYQIRGVYVANVVLPEDMLPAQELKAFAKREGLHRINHAVYGKYIGMAHQILHCLYGDEVEAAKELTSNLIAEMSTI